MAVAERFSHMKTTGHSPTDSELIERARGGSERAFKELVERYEGTVAATVVGLLGWGPEADDIGQETFIRLYKSLHKFRGESSLGTYITRIAMNESLKALKRRQKRRQRFMSEESRNKPAIFENNERDERERRDLVNHGLQQLSEEQRLVVVLRFIDGYSTKETAKILGIPQGTVMSRLSRALEKLEHHLEGLF